MSFAAYLIDTAALVRAELPNAEAAARRLHELAGFVVAELDNPDLDTLLAVVAVDDPEDYGVTEQAATFVGLWACQDETPREAVSALAEIQAMARLTDDLDVLRAEWTDE